MKATPWFMLVLSLLAALFAGGTTIGQERDDEGFVSIFNGKDLNNWDGDPKFWRVEEGAIVGETTAEKPTRGNTFIIWKDGEVDDFELKVSYRIKGQNNSGIQYRSKRQNDWVVGGYQADIDAGDTYSGILYDEKGTRGIMAERGERAVFDKEGKKLAEKFAEKEALQKEIKKEDWNE